MSISSNLLLFDVCSFDVDNRIQKVLYQYHLRSSGFSFFISRRLDVKHFKRILRALAHFIQIPLTTKFNWVIGVFSMKILEDVYDTPTIDWVAYGNLDDSSVYLVPY